MPKTALLAALLLTGCVAGTSDTSWTLQTADLPSPGPGQYALWLTADDADPLLAATFRDEDSITFAADDLSSWDGALVTIERDEPTAPGAEILRGPVTEAGVELSFSLEVEIDGGASLWTPTDAGVNDDNPTQGAWFMERVADSSEAALTLEAPATGWSFAGWTRTQDVYLPMGTFTAPDEPDSNCFFCGDDDVVSVPGEDFVAAIPPELPAAVDLADGASGVVISLSPDVYELSPDVYELSPDVYELDSGEPFRFSFDVLSLDVPLDQEGGVLMDMSSVLVAPSGGIEIPE